MAQASSDLSDDESSVEEEIIVVLDDSFTDHTREEVLAEFVTYSDGSPEKPLPSPPRPKSAFERYNDQLKASIAKPKKAPVVVKKLPAASIEDEKEPGDREDPPGSHVGGSKSTQETIEDAAGSAPETDDAPAPDESEVQKTSVKRQPIVLARWPPASPVNTNELTPGESTAGVKKPVTKRNKVVLPKWLQPADPSDTDVPEDKPAPSIRRWKRPETNVVSAPIESQETLQSTPASTLEQKDAKSLPVEHSETLKSMPSQEAPVQQTENTKEDPPLEDHSSERESSEGDIMSPKPRSPHSAKNSLASRYLSRVSKADTSEHERMAQIEADRARGRWDGKGYVRGDDGDKDNSTQRKNWKFLQQKEKEEKIDEEPLIKLQARVRGFLARRRVRKYVDYLIEETMLKLATFREEEDARRKEEKARLLLDEEEFRRWQEREEERRKNENEAIRRRMYDEQYGFPSWWIETVPHKTMSQKEYQAIVKKDKGETVVDYRLPPRIEKSLAPVTEEEAESEDEGNSNIGDCTGPKTTKTKAPRKKMMKKKKKSRRSCMGDDAVEVEQGPPDVASNEGDKEYKKREQEPQQESAPPAVTKVWM